MSVYKDSLKLHGNLKGKLKLVFRDSVESSMALSLAHTPGIAEVVRKAAVEIAAARIRP